MPVWESEVLDPALNNKQNGGDAWRSRIRGNPKLRAMWFRGVPSHFRGKAWSLAIGNDLTLSKGACVYHLDFGRADRGFTSDAYRQYHSRANRAIQAQRFPADVLETIEHDAGGTLPVLKIFQPGSPMFDDLKDLLCAWYVSRLDEGQGYVSQSISADNHNTALTRNRFSDAGYSSSCGYAAHYDAFTARVHRSQKPLESTMLAGVLLWLN